MSLNYDAAQTAITTAIASASGLPAADVRWAYHAYQGVPRPAGRQFITMMFGPVLSTGLDGQFAVTDLTRPAGTEVELRTLAQCEFTLMLQAFGGTPDGNTSAGATLTKVQRKLALRSVRNILRAASISPFGPGAVRYIPSIEGSKFESRAALDVRCYVDASESEFIGFIASVTMTDQIARPYHTFTVDLED